MRPYDCQTEKTGMGKSLIEGFKITLPLALLLSCLASPSMAGPRLELVLINKSQTSLMLERTDPCTGGWSESWPSRLEKGETASNRVDSPFRTSLSCMIGYKRADNRKKCRFVVSRIRQSLNGRWGFPHVEVSKDRGVKCTYKILSASGREEGDFAVALEIR